MKENLYSKVNPIVGWLLRLAVGVTFIFSGFSKAVDPYGTFYKIGDYVAAMSWHLPDNLMLTAAFGLFCLEFALGLMLLLGCFRRTTAIVCVVVMSVMLPLSLWLAIADPVADCGCFGDALVISNWATFWKNVGLTCACVWLVHGNTHLPRLVTPALQWVSLTLSIAYPIYIGLIGYLIQPPVDFRPYKVGGPLIEASDERVEREEEDVKLVYRDSNGNEKVFAVDDELPSEENGWSFVRQQKPTSSSSKSAEHALCIYDGEEDVTTDVILSQEPQLVLFMPRLSDVSVRDTWPINYLYTYCLNHDIDMITVAAASPDAIEAWKDISLAEYPVYSAEDTSIKEVVRGNPALVYLDNGRIVWKQTLEFTDVDNLMSPEANHTIAEANKPVHRYMTNATLALVFFQVLLICASFIPVFANRHKAKGDSELT